jgi:hypothetical protein
LGNTGAQGAYITQPPSTLFMPGCQFTEANLTKRLIVFVETKTLLEISNEVPIVIEIESRYAQHGQHRAATCQQHVFLCIPNVSLTPQECALTQEFYN